MTDSPYHNSVNAIKSLTCESKDGPRMYAGLPWFFQFWPRDELISLGSLIQLKEFKTSKSILFNYLKRLNNKGRIISESDNIGIDNADATGWLFKRFYDFFDAVTDANEHHVHLSKNEIKTIKKTLEKCMFDILKNSSERGYITNGPNETWMDTTGPTDDSRGGIRIEIQALQLYMYKLYRNLCKILGDNAGAKMTEQLENQLKEKVNSDFWDGRIIADGLADFTPRPNVFIAYYIYPELFTKKIWATCFSYLLEELWLPWGGLSTISKNHGLYTPSYTGEDDKSYHRGDSWYWINNLAAICLNRAGKRKFKKYVDAIYKASSKDIMKSGYKGFHSEISSAEKQEPCGTWAQAWSSAMFIELCNELKKY